MANIGRMVKSFCVFMDVLGLQEMIAQSFKDKKQDELFEKFYASITGNPKFLSPFGKVKIKNWKMKIFTDNIVLGLKINSKSDGEQEFGNAVVNASLFQLFMATDGFFVRGGMSYGDLFIDENIVYGDSLVDAVNIEKGVAVFPRVVLSDSASKMMEKHLSKIKSPKNSSQNNLVLKDADGKYFLNYLFHLASDEQDPAWDVLEIHKGLIESRLEEFLSKPRIWSKYEWLANYHNYFCSRLTHKKGYLPSLMVSENLLKRYPHIMY